MPAHRQKPRWNTHLTACRASLYEFFRQDQFSEQGESEKSLCITLDVHSATPHEAPGNSTYLFKEMGATCATLIERWPAIKPPPGAVL